MRRVWTSAGLPASAGAVDGRSTVACRSSNGGAAATVIVVADGRTGVAAVCLVGAHGAGNLRRQRARLCCWLWQW